MWDVEREKKNKKNKQKEQKIQPTRCTKPLHAPPMHEKGLHANWMSVSVQHIHSDRVSSFSSFMDV